jgi:hypothetical protein
VAGTVRARPQQEPLPADAASPGALRFTEVTAEAGIRFTHQRPVFDPMLAKIMPWMTSMNAGVAVSDYDGDGDDDIYLLSSRRGTANALYRNDGGLRFIDVGVDSGLARINDEDGVSMDAIFADFDNDGDEDLFVAAYGRDKLFLNDGGRFALASASSIFAEHDNSAAALAVDYDGDGWLDLLVGNYFDAFDLWHLPTTMVLPESFERARNGGVNRLYRNLGAFTELAFAEVAADLGLDDPGWALALGAADLDDDGDVDLYIANDYGEDVLYENRGDGTFRNVTRQATGGDFDSGMSVDAGDYDGDGDLDLYVSNITNRAIRQGNMLWSNEGGLAFVDRAQASGSADGGWAWGAKFADFDNDGDLDLYTVNGFVSDGKVDLFGASSSLYQRLTAAKIGDLRLWPDMRGFSLSGYERSRLFRNDGPRFSEVAAAAGLDSDRDGRGVALADFDGDGDLDLMVSNCGTAPALYRNDGAGGGHWLRLRLASGGGGGGVIATRAWARSSGASQIREVDGGNGFCAQSSRVLHYGLGTEVGEAGVEIEIRWPDGERRILRRVPVDRSLVVRR